jgi:hypothetical protein
MDECIGVTLIESEARLEVRVGFQNGVLIPIALRSVD